MILIFLLILLVLGDDHEDRRTSKRFESPGV